MQPYENEAVSTEPGALISGFDILSAHCISGYLYFKAGSFEIEMSADEWSLFVNDNDFLARNTTW